MSLRGCTTRLARAERLAAARGPGGPERPDLVVVRFDENGEGRLLWVVGPYQGCASCGWPPHAYEPFAGDEAALDAYYERHGWQPQRTILLHPHTGSGLRGGADHEA